MKHLSAALSLTFIVALTSILAGCGSEEPSGATEVASGESAPQNSLESAEVHFEWNYDESGVALHGFDAVSYQQDDGPKKGDQQWQTEWAGGSWWFVSEENRKAFLENPAQYTPANGGYCTFGVVLGKKFDGDPEVFARENEKTYLFLNEDVKAQFFSGLTEQYCQGGRKLAGY